MRRFRTVTLVLCAALAISLALVRPIAAQNQKDLSRGGDQFKLGTSLAELSRLVELVEIENPMVEVYKTFGFGNPEAEKEIDRRLEQRYFEARKNLSEGVDHVSLYFYKGRLYYFGIDYLKEYTEKVDWDHFTAGTLLKYGAPGISINVEDAPYFSYIWSDGQTQLEIRKIVDQPKGASRFNIKSYAVVFSDLATSSEVSAKRKQLEEDLKKGPAF